MSTAVPIAEIVDAVIVFTVLEGLALAAWHRLTAKGVAASDFAANMASGLCLMLALRCAVGDAGPAAIAVCLLGAGIAHGTDLLMRWRKASRRIDTETGVLA